MRALRRNRYSLATRVVMNELETLAHTPASFDTLAALTGYDPDTIRVCVRRLELDRRIVTVNGRGGRPNRYLLTSRVVTLPK